MVLLVMYMYMYMYSIVGNFHGLNATHRSFLHEILGMLYLPTHMYTILRNVHFLSILKGFLPVKFMVVIIICTYVHDNVTCECDPMPCPYRLSAA